MPTTTATTYLVAHPSGELYGSDRVLLESVAALRERGGEVVVTLPAGGPLVELLLGLGARVAVIPTPVLRKSYLSPRGLLRLALETGRCLVPSLQLLRDVRPAAVLVNTITVPLWLLLARAVRVPVVCHVHEAEGSARPVVRRLLALPLHAARRIVCNSDFSLAVLTGAAPRLAGRAQVVHNGVPGPATTVAPREQLTGPVRLLYLGRLSERKGVDVAVAAVHHLRARDVAATLDVVGAVFAGYEWYEQRLRDQVSRLGLDDVVTLHGFRTDVWPHLADADVLLVPSRVDEPFGNTAVEGTLAARPVVASATSGLLEATAGMRSARTVTPGDPAALAEAVTDLVGSWSTVRDQAVLDTARAQELYSPATYRRRLGQVVLEVAGQVEVRDEGEAADGAPRGGRA